MEDKSAPQEGPREGAAPASPGAGPNSPLQAANKHDAPPKAEAPQNSPGSLRDITNAEAPPPAPRDDDAFWAAAADAASQAEAEALSRAAPEPEPAAMDEAEPVPAPTEAPEQPAAAPEAEPAAEPLSEPAAAAPEPAALETEPAVEPVAEPVAEPAAVEAEPVAEPAAAAPEPAAMETEPVAEPAAAAETMEAEPATEPATEPVAEPAAAEAPQLVAGFSSPSRWAADGQNDVETITRAPPTPCNTPSSDAALEAPAEADASEEDEADEDAESRLDFYEGSLVRKQRRFAAPKVVARPPPPPRSPGPAAKPAADEDEDAEAAPATTPRVVKRHFAPLARVAPPPRPAAATADLDEDVEAPAAPDAESDASPLPPPRKKRRGALTLTVTRPAAPPQGEDPAPAAPDDAAAAAAADAGGTEDDVPSPVPPPRKKRRGALKLAMARRPGAPAPSEGPRYLPHEPLVLWAPGAESPKNAAPTRRALFPGAAPPAPAGPVRVPPLVAQFLRPHQREGVRFLYDCVAGLREYHPGFQGYGAVLADDMGLGKTLQTVALVYALLRHGAVPPATEPFRRVVVACPCSLVANWKAEFDKWINGRAATLRERVTVKAVDADPSKAIAAFGAGSRPFQVLVISYESLAAHASGLGPAACDLLVCDEAQRLKGRKTKTARALGALRTKRRVLLTGTPLQNDLEEFYALADFANPGVLGPPEAFRRGFARPIAAGLARGADPDEVALRERKQAVLAEVATRFLLRRENRLNAAHLPRKLVQVVVCRATAAQRAAYGAVLADKRLRHALRGKQADVLASIGKLQKICNHPCARPRCICVRV